MRGAIVMRRKRRSPLPSWYSPRPKNRAPRVRPLRHPPQPNVVKQPIICCDKYIITKDVRMGMMFSILIFFSLFLLGIVLMEVTGM